MWILPVRFADSRGIRDDIIFRGRQRVSRKSRKKKKNGPCASSERRSFPLSRCDSTTTTSIEKWEEKNWKEYLPRESGISNSEVEKASIVQPSCDPSPSSQRPSKLYRHTFSCTARTRQAWSYCKRTNTKPTNCWQARRANRNAGVRKRLRRAESRGEWKNAKKKGISKNKNSFRRMHTNSNKTVHPRASRARKIDRARAYRFHNSANFRERCSPFEAPDSARSVQYWLYYLPPALPLSATLPPSPHRSNSNVTEFSSSTGCHLVSRIAMFVLERFSKRTVDEGLGRQDNDLERDGD